MRSRLPSMPWRLSVQIILALVGAAVIVGFLLGEVVRHLETQRLRAELQNQTQRTVNLLSAVSIDAMITEDGPLLETIIQEAVERVAEIQSITALNETGNELARWPRQQPSDAGPFRMLIGYVALQDEKFGRMTIRWAIGPALQQIRDRVAQTWAYTTGVLVCITLVFYFLSNWLILRPLGLISARVASLAETSEENKLHLPASSAREFVALAGSLNTLGIVLHERAEREAALHQAKDAAEAADRSKSRFLAMMSHEIRTPLNGVIGALALMQDTQLSKEQQSVAALASRSSESLLALVDDILDLSQIETGSLPLKKRPFNPATVAEDIMEMMAPAAAAKDLQIAIVTKGDLSQQLVSDPDRIRQVLLNLVSNAVKFTQTGRIEIVLDLARVGKGELRFEVTDTGIGISGENKGRLFREFSQIDESYNRRFGGSGLGLAISKRIVERLRGKIGLESNEGEGSTFWFTLPVSFAIEEPIGVSVDCLAEPEILRGQILLVEDSLTNAAVAKSLLQKKGAKVDHVMSGEDAIGAVDRQVYDLILMDISMPGMDGLEATRRINRRRPRGKRAPIVAMTANAIEGDRQKCLDAGMDDYISKPIRRAEFLQTVDSWLQ